MRQVLDGRPAATLGTVPVYGVKGLGTVPGLDFERPNPVLLAERPVPGQVALGHSCLPGRIAVKRHRIPVVEKTQAIVGGQAGRFGFGPNDDACAGAAILAEVGLQQFGKLSGEPMNERVLVGEEGLGESVATRLLDEIIEAVSPRVAVSRGDRIAQHLSNPGALHECQRHRVLAVDVAHRVSVQLRASAVRTATRHPAQQSRWANPRVLQLGCARKTVSFGDWPWL